MLQFGQKVNSYMEKIYSELTNNLGRTIGRCVADWGILVYWAFSQQTTLGIAVEKFNTYTRSQPPNIGGQPKGECDALDPGL